ncbi:MAG TPA: bifunctional nuclease family protein [Candidatus Bacteroides pullicola]|uniref:Bifunctional nuclease family protein n=1 Tax=Candidatus Bacteroides pullicola TaxID=2838475 RepID=A0A9D1ZLL2_9BACE|nr:bifunctional nuclease family protein [Candidatus Bacteroides pullicola]
MNERKKVELQITSLSNSQTEAGAFIMVLSEAGTQRKLPIAIGASEAQAILFELRGVNTPRPLTHVLFASVMIALGIRLLRVVIYKVENGVFYSYLYIRSNEVILRVDSRTSDAVALALRMKAPILTYEDILNKDHTPAPDVHGSEAFASPSTGNATWLKEALQKAIDQEDYEQAAVLRDQLNHLQQTKS